MIKHLPFLLTATPSPAAAEHAGSPKESIWAFKTPTHHVVLNNLNSCRSVSIQHVVQWLAVQQGNIMI